MPKQNWNAKQYQKNASFVSQLGNSVLELLAPQPGEKILDLGCGDGELTLQIQNYQNYHCEVLGIDASASMIELAKQKGLIAQVLAAENLNYPAEFDAVFTNAVLHWVTDINEVVDRVHTALKLKGRFIGEFGGQDNIQSLVNAMSATFQEFKTFGEFHNPWYFPSVAEFGTVLEKAGFTVEYLELITRPTPLKSGINSWLEIFANGIIDCLTPEQKSQFITEVTKKLKPLIYSETEGWIADYVRIRFQARK
jgi:ubiquinone/menaquinone biosynthesis C-methylase UbiE